MRESLQLVFKDRTDAGKRLALQLSLYQGEKTVTYAIPRGGVPVAIEVAVRLKCPLDIIIVRKIPIPQEPEAG